jgi:hypothetical protein
VGGVVCTPFIISFSFSLDVFRTGDFFSFLCLSLYLLWVSFFVSFPYFLISLDRSDTSLLRVGHCIGQTDIAGTGFPFFISFFLYLTLPYLTSGHSSGGEKIEEEI